MAGTAAIKMAPRQVGVVLTAVWGGLMGRTWPLRFNVIIEHFLGLLGLGSFPTQALIQFLQPVILQKEASQITLKLMANVAGIVLARTIPSI